MFFQNVFLIFYLFLIGFPLRSRRFLGSAPWVPKCPPGCPKGASWSSWTWESCFSFQWNHKIFNTNGLTSTKSTLSHKNLQQTVKGKHNAIKKTMSTIQKATQTVQKLYKPLEKTIKTFRTNSENQYKSDANHEKTAQTFNA